MYDFEKASKQVAESVISDNRKKQNEESVRKLSFAYKSLLGEAYLEKYGSEPSRIRKAVKQAQNDSVVAIVFLIFMICMTVLIYSKGIEQNISIIFVCCVGFGLFIRQKISKKAKAILDEV